MHLGYYLASWGMLRGSTFLFNETNLMHYKPVIATLEEHMVHLRDWDVHEYLDDEKRAHFDAAWDDLGAALLPDGGRQLTLVSKVMLGVWGCIPSFDTYFCLAFKALSESRSESGAFNRVGADTLRLLHQVWAEHSDEIDRVRERFRVWDFASGAPTSRMMSRAKVLDIYGFHTARST